jgi:hypothetical protein
MPIRCAETASLLPLLMLIAPVAACGPASPSSERVAAGKWGGPGVALQVSESGGSVEYDCARGTIDEPMMLDGGRFSVKGVHIRERPGPIREGEEPARLPARYAGQTDGKTMTYSVTLTDTNESFGPYSLTFGRDGVLRKCR